MVIHSRVQAPDWESAACIKFPPPSRKSGRTEDPWFKDARQALPICNGQGEDPVPCPERDKCLLFSLLNNDTYGVWGGLTQPQRRWIRRNIQDKKLWEDDEFLRGVVPPPDYFKDYGDDTEEDEEA